MSAPDDRRQTPDWLSLTFDQQTRFEALNQDFEDNERYDHALVARTNLRADMDFESFDVTVELMDSRVFMVEDDTPIGSAMVNPMDFLQAYVELGDEAFSVKLGRFTQDVGARRFMARNRYRNTINAFDGVNAHWQLGDDGALRAFYSFPVERRYKGDPRDNRMKMDRSHANQRFGGLVYENSRLPFGSAGEIYLLSLDEDDAGNLQTRNRQLYSLGARAFRKPSPASYDYELEALVQEGESRKSTAVTDTDTLDHSAQFLHAEVGYMFDAPWQPRLQAHYDYASGDKDASDDENNGLDSLYGVPRGDFGPTGLYRIFIRNNISSPAVRLELQPTASLRLNTELRDARLASVNAASSSTGLTSATPGGERHLGTQLETVLRWQAIPGRLRVETGIAYLWAGSALADQGIDDKYYTYLQTNLRF
nr:alginate export family protein [Parahaliea mediterranea]